MRPAPRSTSTGETGHVAAGPREVGAGGVLVIDDHRAIAQALVRVLELEGLGPAWAAGGLTARRVIDEALDRRPRLAVVDLSLGEGTSGLGLITPLRAVGARVVLWTAHATPATVAAARRAGAEAVWDKAMALHELTDQIALALSGGRLDPGDGAVAGAEGGGALAGGGAPGTASVDLARLTRREHDVLAGLVAGQAPKEIAAALGVAVPTVRTQVRQLFAKLGVNNQRAAVAVALRSGFPNAG